MAGGRRYAALTAAAGVAVVCAVVGLVLALRPGTSGPGTPAASRHGTPAGSTGPGAASAQPPVGYVWASYHGIELAVPATAQWIYVTCYLPATCYVEFTVPGLAMSCPARLPGPSSAPAADSVSITLAPSGDLSAMAADGRPSRTQVFVTAGVVVRVSAPTSAQVDLVVGSVRRAPVDHLGCADHLASTTPSNPPAPSLVPSGPRSAVVCSYAGMGAGDEYWLVGSHRLDAAQAGDLAAKWAALPTGSGSTAPALAPPIDWVVFDYGTTTRTVAIQRWVDPAGVTDGRHTLVANSAAADPPLPDI